MITFCSVLLYALNSLCPTIAMSNFLLYPITLTNKLFIYAYISLCLLFSPVIGQRITLPAIAGTLLIVALSDKHRISNLTFSALGYLFLVLLNYLCIIILNLLGITIAELTSNTFYFFIFTLVFTCFVCVTTYSLGKYLRFIFYSYQDFFPRTIQCLLLFEVLVCSIVFAISIIKGEQNGYTPDTIYYNAALFTIFFAITFIVFILCIYIMKKNNEIIRIRKEDENLLEYMNKLENMYEEMRIFKHDYMNILSTMSHYIMDENSKKLKDYFLTQILPDSDRIQEKDAVLMRLCNIKIIELKGLLYSKLVAALNYDLTVRLEVKNEIRSVRMKTLDLCKTIGIFCDNAIEAALASEDKTVSIAFMEEGGHLAVIIENSTVHSNINLQEIYQKDVTAKLGHSGLGLYSAKKILDTYENVTHSTAYKNGVFIQSINII